MLAIFYLIFFFTCCSRKDNDLNPLIFQDGHKLYKSSRYEYSSTSSKSGTGPTVKSYESVEPSANVSQLDSLLHDLKQERKVPFDKGKFSFHWLCNKYHEFWFF